MIPMGPVLDTEEIMMRLAHDLRQPLNFASGMLDLCIAGRFGVLEPATLNVLNEIRSSLDETIQMLADGTDTVRVDNGKKSLKPAAAPAADFAGSLAAKLRMRSTDTDVTVDVGTDRWWAIDAVFLERCLTRLILTELRKAGMPMAVRIALSDAGAAVTLSLSLEALGKPPSARVPPVKVPLTVIFSKTVASALDGEFEDVVDAPNPTWRLTLPAVPAGTVA